MNKKQLLERWTSVHALRYFEKFEDREISEERIFMYIDSVKSNVLHVLTVGEQAYDYDYVMKVFAEALNDFK